MLYADDEDASLKTPPVRPNDVIDIEVSPTDNLRTVIYKTRADQRTENHYKSSPGKTPKVKGKVTKAAPPRTKKRLPDSMSRGDPFLSSVISDESPLSDYPIKNSRKKPSDCKCRGLGYNLSPSALLPEEMRQQWGVGVFGKPSTPSSRNGVNQATHSVISSLAVCNGDGDTNVGVKYVNNNTTFQSPTQGHAFHHVQTMSPGISSARMPTDPPKCQLCFQIPCMCYDFSHNGFRIPMKNDSRKIKPALRTTLSKMKDTGIPVSLSCKNPSPVMKRIPCYSCKENSNIISTSNFSKTSTPSSGTLDRNYISPSYDSGYFKAGFSCNRTPNRTRTNFNSVGLSKSYTSGEFSGYTRAPMTPKIRHCQLIRPPRRVMTNISTQSLLSREDPNANHNVYDRNKPPSRTGSQMLVFGNGSHGCSCDTCRRTPNYMPRLEPPEYPSINNQQMVPPVVLSSSQKFRTNSSQSAVPVPVKRYHPYSGAPAPYAYTQTSRQVYQSPDSFSCPSPTFEYDSRRYQTPQVSSTPLSLTQDMSAFEASFSYLDTDIFSSPVNSPSEVKNILDMSVEETVEFFLNIKPPFIPPSSPVPSQEPQEDLPSNFFSSSFSLDDDLPSPTPQIKQSPFNSAPSTSQISFQRPQQTEVTFTGQSIEPNQPPHRRKQSYPMSSHHLPLPSQSMSLLYSSLVSDFEDELRSAIENIPID